LIIGEEEAIGNIRSYTNSLLNKLMTKRMRLSLRWEQLMRTKMTEVEDIITLRSTHYLLIQMLLRNPIKAALLAFSVILLPKSLVK
jgi:hypothetical protein